MTLLEFDIIMMLIYMMYSLESCRDDILVVVKFGPFYVMVYPLTKQVYDVAY